MTAPVAASGRPSAHGPHVRPGAGLLPRGFAAISATFISARRAFVLGTASCAVTPCTSILSTRNRGISWQRVPAPAIKIGHGSAARVWGISFATPSHGFVFGTGLWETTDASARWTRAGGPGGSILSLAAIDGEVLALAARCMPAIGCPLHGLLVRRPSQAGGGHVRRGLTTPSTP